MIFHSMSDIFHDDVSYSHIKMLFNVMGTRVYRLKQIY